MATDYSFLAWRIPGTEEPGGLQSMGSQRVGHQWATNTFIRPLRIYWDWTEAWSSGLILMSGDSCSTGSCARALLSELGYWWSISCLLRQDEKAAGLLDLRSSDTLLPQPLWTRAECSFLRNTHRALAMCQSLSQCWSNTGEPKPGAPSCSQSCQKDGHRVCACAQWPQSCPALHGL